MTEQNETSYYEIALTNRQVLVAFVLLLGAVLLAFLSGVWLGRGEQGLPAGDRQIAILPIEQGAPEIEELQFFSEGAPAVGGQDRDSVDALEPEAEPTARPKEELRKPDLSSLRQPKRGTSDSAARPTTLAQDVGSAGANRDASPPPTRRSSPPAKKTPPRSAAAEPKDGFIIQVFSTREEAQARKVLKRLAAGGYPAYLSPVDVKSQTMYRVRVGPYKERDRADRVGAEVKRKFEYDTWITAASN